MTIQKITKSVKNPSKEEKYNINRLILIGNGFDLAHNFKTSYADFIYDYFKNAIESFVETEEFKDELFELSYSGAYKFDFNRYPLEIISFDKVKETFELFEKSNFAKTNIVFNSKLFQKLYDNLSNLRWIDVENIYFESLINSKQAPDEIKKLNQEFDCIKRKLEIYLDKLNLSKNQFIDSSFTRVFSEKIYKDEVVIKMLAEDVNPSSIHFLNFNYTNTINNYIGHVTSYLKDVQLEHNYIHGELNNQNNPIIFGFGDEIDKRYLEFENLKNNELFTHIKSFKYSQTTNYHDLIRFLESDDFQVYVMGHSCGLSDRTMLNEIFEHENCKSIKVFYYQREDGTDDFIEKTYEISRHFRDKGLMRKKLVPKAKSHKMPVPRKK